MGPRFPVVALLLAVATLCFSTTASAQEARGTVRDSASRAPIAGVVVAVFDSAGASLGRLITGERGEFRVGVPPTAVRLEFLRIGFRPMSVGVAAARAALAASPHTLDVALVSLSNLLLGVRVDANPRCDSRVDRAEARALWLQARAGLLATVVARERNPATVMRLAFDRSMDVIGQRILHQTVRLESANDAAASFFAMRSATDFLHQGFRTDSGGRQTFFSPDADVMLDAEFAKGYCFQVMKRDGARRHQVGLGFQPAERRRGRVDIAGSLWIDTATRALADLEFRYIGLDETSEALGAGGRVSFRFMSNGVGLIDQWMLRLVGAPDPTDNRGGGLKKYFIVREIGGELARATWADGMSWTPPLGRARVRVVDARGVAVAGVAIGLVDTDYRAVSDSNGYADFMDLAPGPYSAFVVDVRLAALGVPLPTATTFEARRGSLVIASLERPLADSHVALGCQERGATSTSSMILARVTTSDGRPVTDVRWRLHHASGRSATASISGDTPEGNGLIYICDGITRGETIRLDVLRGDRVISSNEQRLTERLTVIRAVVEGAAVASQPLSLTPPQFEIAGTIRDSTTGVAAYNATVSLRDTPHMLETDSTGRFRFGSLNRADYTLEIHTPRLDSLGTLKRLVVPALDSGAALTVFLPTDHQIASAMCGDSYNASKGVLVGRVATTSTAPAPESVQVIAEWADVALGATSSVSTTSSSPTPPASTRRGLTETRQRLAAKPDARGTFRMCGVPVDTQLSVHAAADDNSRNANAPVLIQLSPNRRISRVDLTVPH